MTFKRQAGTSELLRDISKFKACEYWMESFRSPETKRDYILALQMFCRFHNTNPNLLVKKSSEQLETMFMKYIVHLKKNAVTYQTKPQLGRIHINSIGNYLFGVKHFLRKTIGKKYREIDWEKVNDMIPEKIRTEYRAYRREEIKSLLDIADLRMRVIILLMTSGGMRVGALPDLKFKHITELPNGMGTISIYADSQKDHYFTFLNLECMSTIERWKQYRQHLEENLTEESYIIRDHFAHFSARTNKAKPLKRNTINRQVRRLVVKVLKDTDKLQTDHGFRKFFDTALMNSDVNYQFKELMMGHSIGLDSIYYDEKNEHSKQKILKEYMKASDALTINDEYRLKQELEEVKKNSASKELIDILMQRQANLEKELKDARYRLVFHENPPVAIEQLKASLQNKDKIEQTKELVLQILAEKGIK